MENTLIIDCSAGMNIILLKDNEVFEQLDSNQKKHTDELLLSVNKLLDEAKIGIKDIKNLCVTVGPGSFTGIRVAISICKGLAIGTHAKVFAGSNFDVYSFNKKENSIYILDAFSDFVYVRIIADGIVTDDCLHFSEVISKIKSNYCGFELYVQNERLLNLFNENNLTAKLAQNNLRAYFENKILTNQSTNINQIIPVYLRASQAEIERNKKLLGQS